MAHSRRMNPKLRAVLIFLLVLCLGVGVGLMFTPIFHIQEISCEGNSRIAAEEIAAAAAGAQGKNIFLVKLSDVRKKAEEIPMVEKASVRRVFPNQLRITVVECVPAGYLYADNQCILVDIEGKVLEVIADARVGEMVATHTPQTLKQEDSAKQDRTSGERTEPTSKEGEEAEGSKSSPKEGEEGKGVESSSEEGEEGKGVESSSEEGEEGKGSESSSEEGKEGKDSESASEEGKDGGGTEPSSEDAAAEPPSDDNVQTAYPVPLVAGLSVSKAEVGKKVRSEEGEKLSRTLELFGYLEQSGLLVRSTYLNLEDINDVTLVIEDRLEVQLGSLENMEYRSGFLAKVINERISATEHAIMDYRTSDIYVRQPDDGKERMKPTATPTPSGSAAPTSSDSPQSSSSAEPSSRPQSTSSAAPTAQADEEDA